jgi:hypothetical protein
MPGNARHEFEFIGKTPWILGVLVVLLGVNSFAGIVFFPVYEHFTHRSISYLGRFLGVQFILLALIGLVFVIRRKAVRYVERGAGRKRDAEKLVRLR